MDPELLKALAAAGMTDEQLRMLGPQLQMGQEMMQPQMAQGSHVGTGPFQTYVAASPWEHLANAMRQGVGAKISNDVRQKQQDLLKQQREARTGAFQGLQTAMSGGQGGTLGEAGGGMARPPDPQAAQALMTAMAGSGDSALQAGAHFGLQSEQLARQNSILQNTMRHQQTMEGLAAGRLENAQQNTGLKAKRWNPATQSFVDVRGGSALPGATSAAAGATSDAQMPPPGSPAFRALQNEQRQWRVMMDPTAKGSGDLHDQWSRISQANVLETLMTNEKGGLQNLTSQQQREAATALARMLGAGGGMSEGQINELDAPSLKRWLAQKQQWLTSAPVGTEAYGVFQNLLDTARREKEQAQSSISSTMAKRLTNFPLMRKYQADSVRNVLEGYGLNYDKDFDPTGKYTGATIGLTPEERGKAKEAAAPAPASPPPTSSTVRVKYKGQLLDIPAGRLPEAIKDGAEQVK